MNAPFNTAPTFALPAELDSLSPPPLLLPGESLEKYELNLLRLRDDGRKGVVVANPRATRVDHSFLLELNVIDKDAIKICASGLDVIYQRLETMAPAYSESAKALIGVGAHDCQPAACGIGRNHLSLVLC